MTSDLLARADALIAHVNTGCAEPGGNAQIEALALCVLANCPVLLWAGPGIDKSAVMHQLAVAFDVPLEVVIASIHHASGFAGSPMAAGGLVGPGGSVVAPDWAVRIVQSGQGLLLLDDVSSAPPATQTALLRVALERRVGGLVLPPAARVVTAINSPSIGAGGWYLGPPLANRFVHLDWTSDPCTAVGSWPRVAIPQVASQHSAAAVARARDLVSGFLAANPGLAHRVPDDPRMGQAWPSPRTWEMACRLLALGFATGAGREALAAALDGAVGNAAGSQFRAYADSLDLPDLTEVRPAIPAAASLTARCCREADDGDDRGSRAWGRPPATNTGNMPPRPHGDRRRVLRPGAGHRARPARPASAGRSARAARPAGAAGGTCQCPRRA